MTHPEPAAPPASLTPYTLWELVRYMMALGTWGFGGPVALVGYMYRDLVEKRRWIGEAEENTKSCVKNESCGIVFPFFMVQDPVEHILFFFAVCQKYHCSTIVYKSARNGNSVLPGIRVNTIYNKLFTFH